MMPWKSTARRWSTTRIKRGLRDQKLEIDEEKERTSTRQKSVHEMRKTGAEHCASCRKPQAAPAERRGMTSVAPLHAAWASVRGARRNMTAIHALSETVEVTGVTEAWLTYNDGHIRDMLDELLNAPQAPGLQTETGGFRIIINTCIRYSTIGKASSYRLQLLTVRI